MGRHKEEGAAITHIRVSHQTRQLLEALKKKHGFATTDKVLKYYLPHSTDQEKAVFLTAKQVYDLTFTDKKLNKMIKKSAAALVRKRN
jgi:hypothetical protein